jgi:hypothetical protein
MSEQSEEVAAFAVAAGTDAVLRDLGFPPLLLVAGRLSIADLYASRRARCGIYVLEHEDGMHYIGQAVDVVRRFTQHRKVSPDIVRLGFFQVARHALDDEERRCIQGAESRGLRLRNRMLVKQLLVVSDLDDVLTPAEQEAWLEDPSRFGSEERLQLDPGQVQRLRYRPQWERFRSDPDSERVVALLQLYIDACVPVPRRTELSFWSVSCLPSTNHSHHPRWAAINIAEMEVFVVGWLPGDHEPWAFVNVSRSGCGTALVERLERAGVEFDKQPRGYRSAGGDDQRLVTGSDTLTAMPTVLLDPEVARTARMLNLQVMRKRPNFFARFHCFDLADHLLGPSGQSPGT